MRWRDGKHRKTEQLKPCVKTLNWKHDDSDRNESRMRSIVEYALPSKVCGAVCSSLEFVQMQTQLLNMLPSHGINLALGNKEGAR